MTYEHLNDLSSTVIKGRVPSPLTMVCPDLSNAAEATTITLAFFRVSR